MKKIETKTEFDTVVIDGDWLLYLISCSGERTFIEVRDSKESPPTQYKNITEFKKTLTGQSFSDIREAFIIEDKKALHFNEARSKSAAIMKLKAKIKKIMKDTGAKKSILAIGGRDNFRDSILLPVRYKGDRLGKPKPLLYEALKDYVLKYETVVIAHGQEADDLLSINQYQHKDCGSSISCTLDKDNRSIPGYLYNPGTEEIYHISGIGYCELITKSSKKVLYGHGRCWEYIQWLVGDPVDFYHPQDLLTKASITKGRSNLTSVKTKLNHTTVYEKVKDFTTDREWLVYIHDTFHDWYKDLDWYYTHDNKKVEGSDYIDILQCYVDCVHMRRWENDKVDIRDVFKKHNII